jgi:hypothetical protein
MNRIKWVWCRNILQNVDGAKVLNTSESEISSWSDMANAKSGNGKKTYLFTLYQHPDTIPDTNLHYSDGQSKRAQTIPLQIQTFCYPVMQSH